MMARLLVVDDEPRMAEIVGMVLRRDGFDVATFTDSAAALAAHESAPFDLVLTDLRMPEPDGLDVLRRARAIAPDSPVILFTAHATISNAIEALREGAFDYVQKPFDNDALRACVRRALEVTRLTRENRYLRAELGRRHDLTDIAATSQRMVDVLDLVRRAARSTATVLIEGESGTGKEIVARAVHFHSDRVGGPFVGVNCKALAPGVLESELFGHERGAFTGADRARPGLFEAANGGTLFLDEIGEVDEAFQAKLLRVLQEREVRRVGGDSARPVDVRIVAATNRDLKEAIASGAFREDLFFRLAVVPIALPPLRERKEDVLPLARHFLETFQRAADRCFEALGAEIEAALLAHDWPGNVRELENAIERAVVLAEGDALRVEDLLLAGPSPSGTGEPLETMGTLQAQLDEATRTAIREALEATGGVKGDAARRLGIDRTTLYRLIRRSGLGGDAS